MSKNLISVYIITFNEQDRINDTIIAAKKVADEIIIIDSGSTDNTKLIVKKHNIDVIYNKWHSYCEQKYFAQNKCRNDWVLMIDADEVISDQLAQEINQLKLDDQYCSFKIKIRNILPNQKKPHNIIADYNVVRLYNKKICSMPKDKGNHDRIFVPKNKKIGQLKGYIKHYSFINIFHATEKFNIHSSEMQKELSKKSKKYSFFRLVTEYPRQFLKYYLFKGMIFAGKQGFIYASSHAYFRFLKIAKNIEGKLGSDLK